MHTAVLNAILYSFENGDTQLVSPETTIICQMATFPDRQYVLNIKENELC